MKLRYCLSILFLLSSFFLAAQDFSGGKTEQQIEQEAFAFFDKENYQSALPLYRELLNVYPQDPEYNYYLGVCQVELNQNITEAITHLKIASSKSINTSVPYYLARAFHMNYQFNSAIRYYRKFKEYYQKKSMGIDRLIEMCQNGLPLVNSYYDVDLVKKKSVTKDEFFRHYELEGFDDRLSKKTKDIKSRYDDNGDKDVASLAKEGQYIYFSSYGKNKKTGRDLYRAKRLKNGGWGEWQALTALNTDLDEIYPFMSNDERTLYFCSQGHSSMGGFDIFSSVYNEITDTWTEPKNLGFPINSTSNDLFYAMDVDGEFACFASSRENGKEDLTVYKIKLSEYPEQRVVMAPELLPQLAILKPHSSSESFQKKSVEKTKEPLYLVKYNRTNFPYFNFPVSNELSYHYLSEFKSEQAKTLFVEAKNDQFNADSLNMLTESLRTKLGASGGEEKTMLGNRITSLEQASFELEKQAENKQAQAQSIESDYLTKHLLGTLNTDIVAPSNTDAKKVQVQAQKATPIPVKNQNVEIKENVPATITSKGYVYHVQVGVFSTQPEDAFFSGLQPLKREVVGNGKLYKYMVGNYSNFSTAKNAVSEIKQLFPNAFVVAYKDGVKANLTEAIKATDQNYQPEPVQVLPARVEPSRSKVEVVKTGKVLFKVQVGAYAEAVPEDVREKLKNFSDYTTEYKKDDRGYTICTVGSFDSYSKVSKLKMELRGAGLNDAFTVAYSGHQKISIQQALEILRQ